MDDQIGHRRHLDRRAEVARRVLDLDGRVGLARRELGCCVPGVSGQGDANVIVGRGADDVRPAIEFQVIFPAATNGLSATTDFAAGAEASPASALSRAEWQADASNAPAMSTVKAAADFIELLAIE